MMNCEHDQIHSGVTNMLRICIVIAAGVLTAVAWGQTVRPSDVNGGGAISGVGNVILTGAIMDYGLGGGTAGVSQSASNKISVGFYPSVGPLLPRNVADPAWLRISGAEERQRPVRMAAWRESSDPNSSINLTGWQL